MARQYSSISQETSLTADLSASTSAVTVNVQSAANLMGGITLTGGDTFTVVIDPDTANEEIVYVTSLVGNALTVTRAQDSTTVKSHATGAKIRHMAIGEDFRLAENHRNASTGVHGISSSSAVVGTTDTQTLTNKTISGTSNTFVSIPNTSTTATSASTANSIVSRDGSGNFSAGTITANLTGAVTGNASSATQLQTGRTFQIVGDIEAAGQTFTGTSDITFTSAIAPGAIVNADINNSAAIAKTKIAGTAITAADVGTVTSTMIGDGEIVNTDISSSAAIAYGKLNINGQITSADIADGTIVNSDISTSAAIALSKLAVDPLARANHTGTQTSGTISDFDTQVRSSRLDQMTAPNTSLSINSQKLVNVADPTANQDAVTLKYLNDQKGAVNGIASLDSNGHVPTSQLPPVAITHTDVVNSQAAMLALDAEVGDIAIRTDVNKTFVLAETPASTLGNWKELLTPTDAVLSVDGLTGAVDLSTSYVSLSGDTMSGPLILSTDPTTSLGAATKQYVDAVAGSATAAASSATAAASSATAAAASYDSFDDRYLGAKSTPPTVDNDGNPLIVGALYWNTVTNAMLAWDGSAWASISSTADIFRYRFTAAGGETSESGMDDNGNTLSYIPGKEQVYLNGVLLTRIVDYTATNGTSISSLAALAAGDILEVITFTAFDLATAIQLSAFDAKGDILVGAAADTLGKLTVGTNGHVLTAASTAALGVTWTNILSSPTLSGTVTVSGDINLSATNAVGSVNDEFALIIMGAI